MSTTEDDSDPSGAVQQGPGLWRTDLQQQDLSVPGRQVVQARVADLATYVVETGKPLLTLAELPPARPGTAILHPPVQQDEESRRRRTA